MESKGEKKTDLSIRVRNNVVWVIFLGQDTSTRSRKIINSVILVARDIEVESKCDGDLCAPSEIGSQLISCSPGFTCSFSQAFEQSELFCIAVNFASVLF